MIDILRREVNQSFNISECSSNSSTLTQISDLPTEILARIFWFFDPIIDQLPLLALVCRKWRDILRSHGVLWRKIFVDPSKYYHWHFSLITCIFRCYGQHVQTLAWMDHAPVYENVFRWIPRLYNLKYLRLPILWTKGVVKTLSCLTELQNIQVNGGFALTDDELDAISTYFTQLKEISLNACWKITSDGVSNLLSKLRHLDTIKLKINSGLRLNDPRSVQSMRNGYEIVRNIITEDRYRMVKVLCIHFVPILTEELWDTVMKLPILNKLNVSNCENLNGIRLASDSLQKLCLFNIKNAGFVCVHAPALRQVTIDFGLEKMEHLEIESSSLKRVAIDGSNALRTLRIHGQKLAFLELTNCEDLEVSSFQDMLRENISIVSLRLGCIATDSLTLDEHMIPNLQELCLLGDFACETVHLRSPKLRLLHTEAENDIVTLNHVYITANHLCKVALIGMPALKTIMIQCVSVDSIEMNFCSDDQLHLESCVIHAMNAIGFLRLFDCKLNLLSLSTPLARTVVLYRCQMTDYVLKMALTGCINIAYLNLEKCREIKRISVESPLMRFMNMFGCSGVHRLDLNSPELLALNIGQCPDLKVFVGGIERNIESLSRSLEIVRPRENVRWSHDFPPQTYTCD